jgi:hypothetical protein
MVVVTLGQSDAANFAAGRYRAVNDVVSFNLYDGKCDRAADPLVAIRMPKMLVQGSEQRLAPNWERSWVSLATNIGSADVT